MRTRRILALLIVAVFMLGIVAACNNGDETNGPVAPTGPTGSQPTGSSPTPGAPVETPRVPSGEIRYGSTTEMNNIFNLQWPSGNNATNFDIWRLTQEGSGTHQFTRNHAVELNPMVVANQEVTRHPNGNKTYTFTLHQDLFFSDGTQIKAENFVFSQLFYNSKVFGDLGASNRGGVDLLGWEDYATGAVPHFAAVRLLGEFQFSVTIPAETLPFYFEESLINTNPTPMHVYAPGVTVVDTPNGARLSDNFTEALVRQHFRDDNNGQLFYPTVFSGAYVLTSYDQADSSAVLDINPFFKGNYDGSQPMVARIILKYTPQATIIDSLATGEVNLIIGQGGERAVLGLDLVDDPASGLNSIMFPRNGYGMIQLRHDVGPTRFVSVRQAMWYALDNDEFARQFTRGHGMVVYGYYGAAQREYRESRDEIDTRLNRYDYNIARAVEVLVADGWIYNADGSPYVDGSGLPRHKEVDGVFEPCIVEWFSTEGNAVSDLIAAMLLPDAARAGLIINQTIGDFPTLLSVRLAPTESAEFHMVNMAIGFADTPMMHWNFSTDPVMWMTGWNTSFSSDTVLEDIAVRMMATEPGDFESWRRLWVELNVRWNEQVMQIPLYSDLYYDFFTEELQEYYITPQWQWSRAIRFAHFD